MKRSLLILLLLGLVAAGAFFVLSRDTGEPQGPKLAPAATVLFVDLADIPRTRERWKQTALYQLSQEPEVQSFLERPKTQLPGVNAIRDKAQRISELKPREAFFALTSIEEEIPKFIAGFKFKGHKEDLDSLVDEARNRVHALWPAGKADLTKYGSIEVETFTYGDVVLAAAFDKHWYLVSDDLNLLKTTLDRVEGKSGTPGGTLEAEPRFKASLKRLPEGSDALVYAQPETVAQRLISLVTASGGQLPAGRLEEIERIQGVAAAMKLDGENVRDALFVLGPGSKDEHPMQRSSLVLTSTNTLFYDATVLHRISFVLPAAAASAIQWLPPGFAMPQFGFDGDAFEAAFGPEFSAILDWPAGDPQPSVLFSLDIRDPGKAAKFLDSLLQGPIGAAWAHRKINGTPYYVMTSSQIPTITPSLALTDKFLLVGPNFEAVRAAVQSMKTPGESLDKTAPFQTTAALVSKPYQSFGYTDSRALCERIYGTLRPFAILWANFAPKVTEYIDPNKLPSTETLMRHLGPIVYSASATEDGRLIESTGPVTFSELLGATAVGAGFAALPTLKSRLQSMRSFSSSGPVPAASP